MIPKVIHQIWKTRVIPEAWREHVLSWRRKHPAWRFVLWTDDDCHRLVRDDFGDFLPVYDAYPYDIERPDVIRYLTLLRLGGVYVDLDLECLRPIDGLLAGRRAIVASELPVHAAHLGRTQMASNAFMAAPPGRPLFRAILQRLCRSDPRTTYHAEVLAKTGPLLLTDLLASRPCGGIRVLEPQAFNPLANGSNELKGLRRGGVEAEAIRAQALTQGSYGIHWFANGWIP
jgi:mannosyltransferase OCH1-like enzyme